MLWLKSESQLESNPECDFYETLSMCPLVFQLFEADLLFQDVFDKHTLELFFLHVSSGLMTVYKDQQCDSELPLHTLVPLHSLKKIYLLQIVWHYFETLLYYHSFSNILMNFVYSGHLLSVSVEKPKSEIPLDLLIYSRYLFWCQSYSVYDSSLTLISFYLYFLCSIIPINQGEHAVDLLRRFCKQTFPF